jgi:hypothetical protein
MEKLNAANRTEAVAIAARSGWIPNWIHKHLYKVYNVAVILLCIICHVGVDALSKLTF